MSTFTLAISFLPLPICLYSWTWHSRFLCNIALYSIRPCFYHHIHNCVLFLLWLHPFILSGVISPLISSSILGTYRPGSSSFSILSFWLFILFMGFSRQEYWNGLPFPSPVDHILSRPLHHDRLGWPHTVWLSFIELDKAVVCVIRLTSFLWLWFVCLPTDASHNTYCFTWVSLSLGVEYPFTAAPAKRSRCSLPWMKDISSPPPFVTFNLG